MINSKKILRLEGNEEILILNSNGKNAISIKNNNGVLSIREKVFNKKVKSNLEIKNISYNELKRYVLYEIYYLNLNAEDVEESIKSFANKFMNYHEDLIHGKEHNYSDIKDSEFQCITYY